MALGVKPGHGGADHDLGLVQDMGVEINEHVRGSYWARAVPIAPGRTPMIATAFPAKGRGVARDTQSMASFRTPGME